jgi:DNA-binding NarL/FixJ family response regulator
MIDAIATNVAATAAQKARVLIVDDHPLLREGVAQLINRQSDMLCCGEAADVSSASTAIELHQPNVVLLDLRLGTGDTLELIKSAKARFPTVAIIVLSQHDEALYAERALRAGAVGYVMKQEASEEVLHAIRIVLIGELYVSRKMTPLILRKLLKADPAKDGTLADLSKRELQVFQLLGAGLGSRQIAEQLGLSIKTIETYREKIKDKIGVHTAPQLIQQAINWVQNRPRT